MELLLEVNGLWKKYSRSLKSSVKYAAQDILQQSFGRKMLSADLRDTEFWSLQDINISVRRGEVLGIIGYNGAGKSTLLKCIAGKIRPERGSIKLSGELGHLIETSAGFSPTLTGRSNVKVRGKLMGMRGKDLERYIGEVAEFAEIGEFFDSPVQFYSSGMKARLGFAASTMMNPDILILDEVLAVGDLPFRIRCYERINDIANNAAVLFVSHSMGHVARLCHRAIYLDRGKIVYDGAVGGAIELYQEKTSEKKPKGGALNPDLVSLALRVNDEPHIDGSKVFYGDQLCLDIDISKLPRGAQLRILLKSGASGVIMDWNSARIQLEWPEPSTMVRAELGPVELNPGTYSLSVQVMSPDGREHLCLSDLLPFRVKGKFMYEIAVQKRANWQFIK